LIHVVVSNLVGDMDGSSTIDAVFIVSNFDIDTNKNGNKFAITNIIGYLYTTNIYSPYSFDTYKGTSDEVLSVVASNVGLKFKRHITGNDNHSWYKSGSNYEFIKYISNRAYIPDDGVFVYTTTDGYLHYNSLYNNFKNEPRYIAKYDREDTDNIYSGIIENNNNMNNNILYFKGYDVINNSGIYNNLFHYLGSYSYYNLDTYNYEYISLTKKNTSLYNMDKSSYNKLSSNKRRQIIGDSSLTSLVSGEYQNKFYKYAITSNNISIDVNTSTPISLFDKIDLHLPDVNGDGLSEPYSGEYDVISISYSFSDSVDYRKNVLIGRYGINNSENENGDNDNVR